jgi:uncharacterized protein (TIGR02246 family)
VLFLTAVAGISAYTSAGEEREVRDFIARWNKAYATLDAAALAALETTDFELVDRFGHWIRSNGPEFNKQLWSKTFTEIYHGKPGPLRQIESVRSLGPGIAIVQARAHHTNGVTLDDGTHIPPFSEIDTYTLVKTPGGWRVALLNIHNQIDRAMEKPGEHVPVK